jgi:hypothetical protein
LLSLFTEAGSPQAKNLKGDAHSVRVFCPASATACGVWRVGGDNAIMAVCAHAQTAIFFFGVKLRSDIDELHQTHVRVRVANFAASADAVPVVVAATLFADFCAIRSFSRQLPGSHDARL